MILESIVTTSDAGGRVNIAPMGPWVDGPRCERWVLRPFRSSRTFQNLAECGRAVIHVTDDALLFARAAVDSVSAEGLVEPVDGGRWWRLKDCHRWFAVETDPPAGDQSRIDVDCRVIHSGVVRPFFGFNRAKHAVLEAAILATRTHLLSAELIDEQLARLQPLIDKTAGPDEHEAFEFLSRSIQQRRRR